MKKRTKPPRADKLPGTIRYRKPTGKPIDRPLARAALGGAPKKAKKARSK